MGINKLAVVGATGNVGREMLNSKRFYSIG